MTMMTPVPGPTPPAVAATPPVRPVPPVSTAADTAARDDRQQDDRGERQSETTLRYKFDWLLQREVSAGTLSSDKAAEMIRLFERTTTVAAPDADTTPSDDAASPPGGDPAQTPDPATALVDRLRDQFAATGPYDDAGNPGASIPMGMVVDERA